MRRTVMAILLSAGVLTACGTSASEVQVANTASSLGYDDIVASLTAGKDVEITTELTQCATPEGVAGPAVTGGLHIATYQVVQGKYIAFSDVHQSLTAQNARITEYLRYRVTPAGAVTLTDTVLDGTDKVLATTEYDCKLGKGAYFHWH
ncbi:VirK family protein [Kutzneria sp. NPDC052558]|uniref:VirK family protein n=1 Tax=Kutzneria sp. NPDC052558 TaxID=3364121 RepID=UPI0037C787F7